MLALNKTHERKTFDPVLTNQEIEMVTKRLDIQARVKTNLDVDIEIGASASRICVEIHIESGAGVGFEREIVWSKRGNIAHKLATASVVDLDHSTVGDCPGSRWCQRLSIR